MTYVQAFLIGAACAPIYEFLIRPGFLRWYGKNHVEALSPMGIRTFNRAWVSSAPVSLSYGNGGEKRYATLSKALLLTSVTVTAKKHAPGSGQGPSMG